MPIPQQRSATPSRRPALERWLRQQEAAQQPIWPIPPHLLWEGATPETLNTGRCEHRWRGRAGRCPKSATHGLLCRTHAHQHSAPLALSRIGAQRRTAAPIDTWMEQTQPPVPSSLYYRPRRKPRPA